MNKKTTLTMGARLRYLMFLPLFVFGMLSILATGGGGGGGGGDGVTTLEQIISGSVSETVAGAAVSKAVASDDAIVEIISYNSAGTEIDSASTPVANGFFSAQVDMAKSGGYLLLTVAKDGFTDFSKRIDFTDPSNVNVAAELRPLDIVVATAGSVLKSNGETVRAFSFAVVRLPDGTRKAVAGSDNVLAAKAAATDTELEVQIPANSVDADTLIGRFSNFDPSNPEDEGNFPGNYQDSDGNTLLSVAFDYINITDENGSNVSELVPVGAAKAAVDPTVVYRWIPSGSCGSLSIGDTDQAQAGFQVPVYTLNPRSHLWELLGRGAIVVPDGVGGWTLVDAASVTPGDCDTSGYYLEIQVSNEEFLHYWWNLDYPLVFAQPTQFCITRTLQDDNQNKLIGWTVRLTDNDDGDGNSFGRTYGFTDSNGRVQLSVIQLGSADGDMQGTLQIWNPLAGVYQNETVPLGESPNCATGTTTITNPLKCTVQGQLTDAVSGAPRAGLLVRLYAAAVGHSDGVYTDGNGEFSAAVLCQEDYQVGIAGDWSREFNVNQTTSDHSAYENSDNGNTVVLKDVALSNQKPYVTGWLDAYVIYSAGSTTAQIYASDTDGDYPLSYTLKDASGAINISRPDAITAGVGARATETLSGLTEGTTYELSVTVTDKLGATTTRDLGNLIVCGADNCGPTIRWAYPNRYQGHNGDTINFYSSAYDLDGDYPLTYSWAVDGEVVAATQNASYMIPLDAANNDAFAVTLTVTDSRGATASKGFTITSSNRPPYIIDAGADKIAVQAGETVNFAVQAYDQDGDPLSYSWSVDGEEVGTAATASFDIPADAADGTIYAVQIEVSDDKGGSSTVGFTLTVGSGEDVEVIIR